MLTCGLGLAVRVEFNSGVVKGVAGPVARPVHLHLCRLQLTFQVRYDATKSNLAGGVILLEPPDRLLVLEQGAVVLLLSAPDAGLEVTLDVVADRIVLCTEGTAAMWRACARRQHGRVNGPAKSEGRAGLVQAAAVHLLCYQAGAKQGAGCQWVVVD